MRQLEPDGHAKVGVGVGVGVLTWLNAAVLVSVIPRSKDSERSQFIPRFVVIRTSISLPEVESANPGHAEPKGPPKLSGPPPSNMARPSRPPDSHCPFACELLRNPRAGHAQAARVQDAA